MPVNVSVEYLHLVEPTPRVLFPFCGVFGKKGTFGEDPLNKADGAIARIQYQVHKQRMFFVAAHPAGTSPIIWMKLIKNARALRIDQSAIGYFSDVMIPISSTMDTCEYGKDIDVQRDILLFSCGSEHSYSKRYKGLAMDCHACSIN
jgi:hypothetical protein